MTCVVDSTRQRRHYLATICWESRMRCNQITEGAQMKTSVKIGLLAALLTAGISVSLAQKSSGDADEQAIRKLDKE